MANGRPRPITDPAAHVAPVAESYAYLLGLYLGDGHITSHPRGVLRLAIYLDARYPGIIEECTYAMADVLPMNSIGHLRRPGSIAVNAYSKSLAALFPQHGSGRKHTRRIELVPWQSAVTREHPRSFLRGLVHSDGTRALNTVGTGRRTYQYARYQFSNMSQDIKDLFCEHCDLLGIEWRVMNRKTISVAQRASVARMDEFIGPKSGVRALQVPSGGHRHRSSER